MARSQQSFSKRERELKREKKRKDKEIKKAERQENKMTLDSDDMIAYVDEFGQVTSTPPDPSTRVEVKLEDIEIGIPKREEEEYDPIRTGIVTFFNESKGFGFIRDLETQESVFVHVNNTKEEVRENNKVRFETEQGPRGLAAVKVEIWRDSAPAAVPAAALAEAEVAAPEAAAEAAAEAAPEAAAEAAPETKSDSTPPTA